MVQKSKRSELTEFTRKYHAIKQSLAIYADEKYKEELKKHVKLLCQTFINK